MGVYVRVTPCNLRLLCVFVPCVTINYSLLCVCVCVFCLQTLLCRETDSAPTEVAIFSRGDSDGLALQCGVISIIPFFGRSRLLTKGPVFRGARSEYVFQSVGLKGLVCALVEDQSVSFRVAYLQQRLTEPG